MMVSLRKWLLAGLLVILPVVVTLWVVEWIISTLDKTLLILPTAWHPDKLLGVHIPGFGALLALAILLVLGALASNFVGNKLLTWWHSLLNRIPVVRSIYSGVKQVSDTLFSDSGNAFRKAVLIQWPREGVWTIAFVTGTPGGDAAKHLSEDYLSVYVPTTPNPTGGYFVMLKASDCIELKMSVDDALKYIVSMGVVSPDAPALVSNK
jgi:uncharacterized membrane protein